MTGTERPTPSSTLKLVAIWFGCEEIENVGVGVDSSVVVDR